MKVIIVNKKRFITWICLFIVIAIILLCNIFSAGKDTLTVKSSSKDLAESENSIGEHENEQIKVVLGKDNETNSEDGNTQTNTTKPKDNTQSNNVTTKNQNTSSNSATSKGDKTNSKTNNNTTNKTNTSAPTGTTPYYIKVNCGAQVVTIYKKDKAGKYTVPVKAMICSTGTYTPKSGIYKIPGRWNWGALVGGVYGQYVTVITGDILFHSVPYTKRYDAGSLEYWEYDKLGTKASAGCVRLTVEDAIWIHKNCANGTQVEFYSSSNPGPLGKPSAKKISNAKGDLKNWDPTDPSASNPWKKQEEEISNKKENNTNSSSSKNETKKPTTENKETNTDNKVNDTENKETNKESNTEADTQNKEINNE